MVPDRLSRFTEPIPVLDQGHVRLVDVMGDDQAVVQAARVSYGKGCSEHVVGEEESPGVWNCSVCRSHVGDPKGYCVAGDRSLIRYMMRHHHGTPFEMCELKFHIRMPMDAHRQQVRHRTASINEWSTRYTEAIDARQVTTDWRAQAASNKQGSAGLVPNRWEDLDLPTSGEWIPSCADVLSPQKYLSERERELHELSMEVYQERLAFGVAKEQARKDLLLSNYTEYYWKIDLRNLLHYLSLRMDEHAQFEIRSYANAIAEIVKEWVPLTWEAWVDYVFEAHTFSRQEMAILRFLARQVVETEQAAVESASLGDVHLDERAFWRRVFDTYDDLGGDISKRERAEFLRVLGRID